MADKTQNYSTDYHSAGYYRTLVELRLQSNKLLTELQFDADPERQKQFKRVLSLLAKEMAPKYQRREDTEKPDALKKDVALDLSNIDVNECADLLRSFRDLQEKLGITSMASNEYKVDEKGAVKKK